MTWRVVYRAKDGALREEAVEAADRAECVAACRARGIAPTSVREGNARGGAARPPRPCGKGGGARGTSRRTALVVALVALAAGGGAWWWARGGRGAADGQEPVPPALGDGSGGSAALPGRAGPKATDAPSRRSERRQPAPPEPAPPEAAPPEAAPPGAAPSGAAPGQASEGQKPDRPPAPERVFKTDAEALLAMATPAEPGMAVPPLPPFSEETTSNSAERALATVAQATSNDTEQTISAKIVVEGQKDELRSLMKDGWTFADYLTALHKKHTDDAEYLREAQRLDSRLRNDPDVSDAEYSAYRKKIDEELRERGIPGLTETERKVEQEMEEEERGAGK